MKKFFALMALITVTLTACEKGNDEQSYSSAIKLSKDVVEFGKNGGEQIVKFTIQNPEGGKVTAEENADWFDAFVEFNSEVVISVDTNEGDAREAKITIKYASAKDVTITVKQRAGNAGEYDADLVANHFEGIYFGTEYSDNYNYYVILSDIGATINGDPKANGTYYYFDFYSSVAGDEEYPVLPNGTYNFDSTNSCGNLTFSKENSWYCVMDEKGEYVKTLGFKNATVTVEDDKFVAVIEMSNGEMHRIAYEGDLYVGSDNIYSTFTEDFIFNIEGATITATNYGDVYSVGKQSWYIEAVKGNDLFMLEVFSTSTEHPAGVYTTFTGNNYDDKYIPGYIDESGLGGSWYAKLTSGTIKGDVMAPIASGTVQILVEGGNATINYATTDDAGYKIEGSISGSYKKAEKPLE